MSKQVIKLTIKEAAEHFNVSSITVRRKIKSGELDADKVGNQWFVHVEQETYQNEQAVNQVDLPVLTGQLQSEISHLREQLTRRDEQIDHFQQIVAMSQKNIGALTEQLDDSRQMIEDMRQRRTVWQRLKGVFVAESG